MRIWRACNPSRRARRDAACRGRLLEKAQPGDTSVCRRAQPQPRAAVAVHDGEGLCETDRTAYVVPGTAWAPTQEPGGSKGGWARCRRQSGSRCAPATPLTSHGRVPGRDAVTTRRPRPSRHRALHAARGVRRRPPGEPSFSTTARSVVSSATWPGRLRSRSRLRRGAKLGADKGINFRIPPSVAGPDAQGPRPHRLRC